MAVERSTSMPMGVVIERRAIDHPWQKWRWTPVAVVPGAGPVDGDWRELERDEVATRWHAATLPLVLHRKETEAYRENLSSSAPGVYVVLRGVPGAPPERAVRPLLVTVSPFEAQHHLEAGDDIVERVALPPALRGWMESFVARHHVEEPFRKRKRQRYDPGEAGFGHRPDRPEVGPKKRVH